MRGDRDGLPWRHRLSLRFRITAVTAVVVAVVVAAGGVLMLVALESELEDEADDAGRLRAGEVATLAERGDLASSLEPMRDPESYAQVVAGSDLVTATGDNGSPTATDAKVDVNATPSAGWRPYDPTLKPAPGGTEHKLTMHAVEKSIEVAPGVTQKMWTFDGRVPGTTLRGQVGDLFTITLVNDGTIDHSIDLHASKVAWNKEMRSIKPGQRLAGFQRQESEEHRRPEAKSRDLSMPASAL